MEKGRGVRPAGASARALAWVVRAMDVVFNRSRLNMVVVCALTPNLKRIRRPGNVALECGEANLPKASVVNVTQLLTVNKSDLGERIGALSPRRVREIIAGINLVLEPREPTSD